MPLLEKIVVGTAKVAIKVTSYAAYRITRSVVGGVIDGTVDGIEYASNEVESVVERCKEARACRKETHLIEKDGALRKVQVKNPNKPAYVSAHRLKKPTKPLPPK